jgi:Spy/CpxP family protein refolding chaperone
MFGFVIGTAALAGMFMFARRHRHGRYGYGQCGPRGYARRGRESWGERESWEGGGPWSRSRGMERMVGWLATRLEATPEQYRVIRNEVEQFMDKTHDLRRELRLSRDDIAKAMSGASFDEEVMGESFARQDDRIREVREQMVGALARIHDVLDPRQRDRLVELTNRFSGRRAW